MPDKSAEDASAVRDERLLERILAGEVELYEIVIRRYNRRLYRITRAILGNDLEAEDVIQETHARAYEHLAQFSGRSLFSTWLTRIAVYEAWNRVKQKSRQTEIDSTAASLQGRIRVTHTPEHDLLAAETRTILEQAVDALPESLRSVFVMRSLEEMTTAETAKCLDITAGAVKVRLLRARHILRDRLYERAHAASSEAFQFLGERCDRITRNILSRITEASRGRHVGPGMGGHV